MSTSNMNDKATVGYTLIAWFIIVNLIILVWSTIILLATYDKSDDKPLPSTIPTPPAEIQIPLNTSDDKAKIVVALYTQRVEAYKKQVEAYNSEVTAYTKYLEAVSKSNQFEAYKLVAKETLSPFVTSIVAGLVAFAFTKRGLEVLNNYVAAKNGENTRPLSSFF